MPFHYKTSARPQVPAPDRAAAQDAEASTPLVVQGKEAKATEYLWAQAWDYLNLDYQFQALFQPPTTLPGQDYSVDYIIQNQQPVEIDGEWIHKSADARARDQFRDAVLNDFLQNFGYLPIRREIMTGEETLEDVIERARVYA